MTATPTAAPTKRLTIESDEPSPACAGGSPFIITADPGVMSIDSPSPTIAVASAIQISGSPSASTRAPSPRAMTARPAVIVARAPTRANAHPALIDATPNASANGTSKKPTARLDSAATSVRYCGTRNNIELNPRYATKSAGAPAATARTAMIRTSRSGAVDRSWRATNTVSSATPPTSPPITTGAVHPRPGPSITPNIKSPSPVTETSASTTSRRPRSSPNDSGILWSPTSTPTATTETTTRNTEPQAKRSNNNPPRIGPRAKPIAPNADQTPLAGASVAAAPTTIRARAAMRSSLVGLNAARKLAAPKSAYPARTTRRRPYRSARPPPATSSPVSYTHLT